MLLRKRLIGTLVLLLLFISIPLLMRSKTNPVTSLLDVVLQRKPQDVIPPTTHIVLFQFKQSVTPFQVKEITSKMLALKKSCIHPSTRTSYIKSITGGKDNSIEDLQDGISHAFIVQFYTNEDRTYYVDEDPVHQAFKDAVSPYLEKTQVVDFQEGVFTHAD